MHVVISNLAKKYFLTLETIFALGIKSVVRVGKYRLSKKLGFIKSQTPIGKPIEGNFFPVDTISDAAITPFRFNAFSWFEITIPPANGWHNNCMTSAIIKNPERHWSDIPDFDTAIGDIKTVWEASRFDWLPLLAVQVADADLKAKRDICKKLNRILSHWSANNPVNQGPNWKCGQETSLRVINLMIAYLILTPNEKPTPAFVLFINQHLERVIKSLSYAIGQDNNHAVSEAVALYIGGMFLTKYAATEDQSKFNNFRDRGRKALEQTVQRLVFKDGMFSQYSAVYHRMLLVLVAVAEAFGQKFNQPYFNSAFYDRMRAATCWMLNMIDVETGDVPNFGANDGTFLLNLDNVPYRDFKPSAQFAAQVFLGESHYANSKLCKLFPSLSAQEPTHRPPSKNGITEYLDGGMLIAANEKTSAYLRLPIFKFRPSQADALHLDIWRDGENITLDTGTYSYANLEAVRKFSGTAAHNTVRFDGRDQMPRLGRFLFAKWLKGSGKADHENRTLEGEYKDYLGCTHKRKVCIHDYSIHITDIVSGFSDKADLSWHLMCDEWVLSENSISSRTVCIRCEADSDFELTLETSPRSLFYLSKDEVPVARLTVKSACTIKTIITFLPKKNI